MFLRPLAEDHPACVAFEFVGNSNVKKLEQAILLEFSIDFNTDNCTLLNIAQQPYGKFKFY